MRTCSDCGQEREDLTKPCPNCGSTRQTLNIHVTDIGFRTDAIAELGMTFGPDRRWYEKWHSVRQLLQVVENDCTPVDYKGNDVVRRDFGNFFVECIHLGDWLWQDKSTGLSKARVLNYIRNDPDLTICRAAANISKHHTRDDPNAMTARISGVTWKPAGVSVSLEWSKGSNNRTDDALDLARRCVASWERYLKANGLQSPI